MLAQDQQVIERGHRLTIPDKRVVGPDGSLRWMSTTKVPFAAKATDEPAVLGISIDITERRQAEEELRKSEKLASIGTLVASVAHEVRNPLFALSATIDAVEVRYAQPLGEYLKPLREQVDRLSKLMRELLEYGEPREPVLKRQPLLPLVQRAVDSCQPEAERQGVEIRVNYPEALPAVSADAGRFVQLLQNLIENGVQHSHKGGVVRIEAARVSEGQRHEIECVVRDSGSGLSEADISNLFEPFFTMRRGGTGLGLAIASKIATEHEGTITASNAPEGGAIFTVRLPLSEEA